MTGTGPAVPPPRGTALLRAVAVVEALRAPDGDAWTHAQTHASLARYLLEEAHEVLEVIEHPAGSGPAALADELGDLLFQVLLHARLGEEADPPWDVDDVARGFVAKMERRNPHVFAPDGGGLADRSDVDAIVAQWHAVKAREAQEAHGTGEVPAPAGSDWGTGVPALLPALQRAAKIVHRARAAGGLEDLLARADAASTAAGAPEGSDLGRALLDLVVAAEARDVDPESALRGLLSRTLPGPPAGTPGTP